MEVIFIKQYIDYSYAVPVIIEKGSTGFLMDQACGKIQLDTDQEGGEVLFLENVPVGYYLEKLGEPVE